MLLDFLKCTNEFGVAASECRYVGMGGTMFYDFHLMHRFLGINNMISLERNEEIFMRCEFNCPFDFIEVDNIPAAVFLAQDDDEITTIYWFDYDDGFGPDVTADIMSLGTRLKVGGSAFVTVYADPPGVLGKQTKEQRLEYFQNTMGEFSVGLLAADLTDAEFSKTIIRVLSAAFQNAFSARKDGRFQALFKIQYKDSAPMVTVGGCFTSEADAPKVLRRVKADLPFLLKEPPYKIKHLNLTERERQLFDMAVTKRRRNSKQSNSLLSMGFKKSELDAYRDLIRFLPRYYESII